MIKRTGSVTGSGGNGKLKKPFTVRAVAGSKNALNKFEKSQSVTVELKETLADASQGFTALQANVSAFQEAGDTPRVNKYIKGNVALDNSQIEALEALLSNRFASLIGYAGTGKTTVLSFLVDELKAIYGKKAIDKLEYDDRTKKVESKHYEALPIYFAAFTGRAAEMIMQKLPKDMHSQCSTIHRLLGYHPEATETIDAKGLPASRIDFVPAYDRNNKLPYKCIIIDEAGMCPPDLFNNLMQAITDDCRVYLVGDISQLPPVMGHSPLPFSMKQWPCSELQKIHRQAEGSPIIFNSREIREGRAPKDFAGAFATVGVNAFEFGKVDGTLFRTKICQVIEAAYKAGRFDPWQDILLVPIAKRENEAGNYNEASAGQYNADLRKIFNGDKPQILLRGGMRAFEVSSVAIGDKLMITKNGTVANASGGYYQVNNGMLGRVVKIEPNPAYKGNKEEVSSHDLGHSDDDAKSLQAFDLQAMMNDKLGEGGKENEDENTRQCSHVVHLELLGRNGATVALKTAGEFSNLIYGYAITVHKSQGGEYRKVFIGLCGVGAGPLLSRELLYTAVTRAKEACVIFHDGSSLQKCLKSQKLKGETLADKAESVIAQSKAAPVRFKANGERTGGAPILPEPERIVDMQIRLASKLAERAPHPQE